MNSRRQIFSMVGSIVVGWVAIANSQEAAPTPVTTADSTVGTKFADSVAIARDQAKLMHKVYAATLEMVHDRYFRNDRDAIPARALEDVFAEVKRQTRVESRWIGVNARTLSIRHEPKGDFEQFAAHALGGGEGAVERIEGKVYRRAEVIPLATSCLMCHGTLGIEPKTPRFAGLLISIPLPN